MAYPASYVWRDFVTDAVPASGRNEPAKSDVRAWGAYIESLANLAFTNGRVYNLKSNLLLVLSPVANSPALVVDDPTPGNDGLYMKVGGSGVGSWSQLTDFVPGAQIVRASDVGSGTPNAIIASTNLAVSAGGSQLVILNVFEENTSSPVTVTLTGLPAKTIKTRNGNDVPAGGLSPGPYFGQVSGSTFRLLTDIVDASIVAAAEAAMAGALSYATVAQEAMGAVITNRFPTKATLEAYEPAAAPPVVETMFLDSDYVPGSGSMYTHSGTVDPGVEAQVEIEVSGVTNFYIPSNRIHRPSQHGVKRDGDPGDNRLGLIEMFELANRTGNEIDMGRNGEVYEIDDTITHEFTKDSIIRGTGATVKLASAGVKLFALRFLTDAEKVDHEGFTVDANSKAPNALWYENYAASYVDADVKTIRLVGVEGSNGKRILLADYWGAGITVRGAWSHLLSRDCKSSGMIGASGSHDTAQGVMGFYFGRNSDGLYPVHKDIYNPTIDTVANEDTSMAYNMDGIHIADNLPGNDGNRERASTYISGGTFRNCWGRAIKCQALNVDIYSPMIIQADGPVVGGEKKSTCFVSLQYGEGTVRGLRAQCESASTISVVDGTARTFANGKMLVDGAFIQGKGTIPNIDQILYRYSDNGYTTRGAASVINTQIKSVIPERFVNFYSRLNGTEQVVCNNNWSEAIGTSGILIGNDNGAYVTHVFAQGNFNGSTSKPLVATTTATATTVQSGNIGFTS